MIPDDLSYPAVLDDVVARYNESLNIAAAQDQGPPGDTDYERAVKMLTMSQAALIQSFAAALAENNRKIVAYVRDQVR